MKKKIKKKTILILMGRYLPGYKDGGPVRTIINLVDCLGTEYDFKIVTNDRDRGDSREYPDVKINEWNTIGKAKVYYVPPKGFTFTLIKKLAYGADVVYSCGFYDNYGYKALLLKKLNIIKAPLVVASMGSFSRGALEIKSLKKKLFIKTCKKFGLFDNIIWSVSSNIEKFDIEANIGMNTKSLVAEDLPRKNNISKVNKKKKHNSLSIVFFSRITSIKNLKYAIEIVSQLRGNINFTILGIIEDHGYWEECKKLLNTLPDNILWSYSGEIDTQNVITELRKYDVLILPTKGENYGHVIFEALSSGCIPIISDRTPWQELDKYKCGNVINLDMPTKFIEALESYSAMGQYTFQEYSDSAINYAISKQKESIERTSYREIFNLQN